MGDPDDTSQSRSDGLQACDEPIFPSRKDVGIYSFTRHLRREQQSLHSCLHSVAQDASFVAEIRGLYPRLPTLANLRCGLWYSPSFDGTCYFKSTDGHSGIWSFSVTRLNWHVAETAAVRGGVIVVDATRKGKRFPDALSKTIPIWAAVINRAIARVRARQAGHGQDKSGGLIAARPLNGKAHGPRGLVHVASLEHWLPDGCSPPSAPSSSQHASPLSRAVALVDPTEHLPPTPCSELTEPLSSMPCCEPTEHLLATPCSCGSKGSPTSGSSSSSPLLDHIGIGVDIGCHVVAQPSTHLISSCWQVESPTDRPVAPEDIEGGTFADDAGGDGGGAAHNPGAPIAPHLDASFEPDGNAADCIDGRGAGSSSLLDASPNPHHHLADDIAGAPAASVSTSAGAVCMHHTSTHAPATSRASCAATMAGGAGGIVVEPVAAAVTVVASSWSTDLSADPWPSSPPARPCVKSLRPSWQEQLAVEESEMTPHKTAEEHHSMDPTPGDELITGACKRMDVRQGAVGGLAGPATATATAAAAATAFDAAPAAPAAATPAAAATAFDADAAGGAEAAPASGAAAESPEADADEWDVRLHLPPWLSHNERQQIELRLDGWVDNLLDIGVDVARLSEMLLKPLRPLWISQASRIWVDQVAQPEDLKFTPLVLLSASQTRSYTRQLCSSEPVSSVRGGQGEPMGAGRDSPGKSVDAQGPSRTFYYLPGAGDDEESWSCGLTPELFWEHSQELLQSSAAMLSANVASLLQQQLAHAGCPFTQCTMPPSHSLPPLTDTLADGQPFPGQSCSSAVGSLSGPDQPNQGVASGSATVTCGTSAADSTGGFLSPLAAALLVPAPPSGLHNQLPKGCATAGGGGVAGGLRVRRSGPGIYFLGETGIALGALEAGSSQSVWDHVGAVLNCGPHALGPPQPQLQPPPAAAAATSCTPSQPTPFLSPQRPHASGAERCAASGAEPVTSTPSDNSCLRPRLVHLNSCPAVWAGFDSSSSMPRAAADDAAPTSSHNGTAGAPCLEHHDFNCSTCWSASVTRAGAHGVVAAHWAGSDDDGYHMGASGLRSCGSADSLASIGSHVSVHPGTHGSSLSDTAVPALVDGAPVGVHSESGSAVTTVAAAAVASAPGQSHGVTLRPTHPSAWSSRQPLAHRARLSLTVATQPLALLGASQQTTGLLPTVFGGSGGGNCDIVARNECAPSTSHMANNDDRASVAVVSPGPRFVSESLPLVAASGAEGAVLVSSSAACSQASTSDVQQQGHTTWSCSSPLHHDATVVSKPPPSGGHSAPHDNAESSPPPPLLARPSAWDNDARMPPPPPPPTAGGPREYYWLPIKTSKYQRDGLIQSLAPALEFASRQLAAGRTVLIHDVQGVDQCVCVAVALLLACFDAGDPSSGVAPRYVRPFFCPKPDSAHDAPLAHGDAAPPLPSSTSAAGSGTALTPSVTAGTESETDCASKEGWAAAVAATATADAASSAHRVGMCSSAGGLEPQVTKHSMRQRLAWLSSCYPQARPTRGNLKQVYNFFHAADPEQQLVAARRGAVGGGEDDREGDG